jgi:hypothetical protein
VFYLLLIALAMAGEVLPEGHNRFYAIGEGQPPIVLLREESGLWNAKMMDHKNLELIPQGLFHLNGLAIGRKADGEFDYYDMSEILSIETIADLTERDQFDVQSGQIFVDHNYQSMQGFHGLQLRYSPNDIRSESVYVTVVWQIELDNEMILPESEHRKLTASDIESFSETELNAARNEIFARHGYIFKSKPLTYLFSATSWYQPKTKDVTLTEVEKYNVALLKKHELQRATSSQTNSQNQEPQSHSDDYLMPDSDQRLLNKAELMTLSSQTLRLMRNEIFARHGYVFKSRELNEYFLTKRWYAPLSNTVELSSIEAQNVALIKSVEESKKVR